MNKSYYIKLGHLHIEKNWLTQRVTKWPNTLEEAAEQAVELTVDLGMIYPDLTKSESESISADIRMYLLNRGMTK